jgi:tetratricopeptide (TPR) repeat protein
MSRIINIAGWAGKPRASVIFVHGLGGHAYDTWRRAPDDGSFWPLWLAEDVEGLAVNTLAYEAPPSNWLGTAMPLQDRAVNILEILLGTPSLKDGPVVFICHSLGGLIVKQILLDLDRQKGRRREAAALLNCVTQVVFLATPHTGSRKGSLLDRLRFLAWPSSITRTLGANDPSLRSINVDYRGLADDRRDTLHHLIFYETRGTPAGVIVDEASSDPGLTGRPPIPIDADHITIVKPADRAALQYARTRDFILEGLPEFADHGNVEVLPLPPIKLEQPWNLVPKLLRVAVIGLVCVIAFKEIQALIAPPAPVLSEGTEREIREIRVLVGKLVADTATKGPGVERAVGEAVTAAVAGATEGDERLAKALDLLKANKIAEAAELFRAVAADKAARIKRDSKDAAAAYRNLGAIAGLGDPKRALDAYQKAVELYPDDIESLLWVAQLEEDRGDVADAEMHYGRALALATTDDRSWAKYSALLGIGDTRRDRGNLPEALKSYRDALAIADRLAKADPGNAGRQRDLSVSYHKIGDVLVAQGHLPDALKPYRDGLAIRDRLATADPGNAGWQHDLSVSYAKVAVVFRRTGEKADALTALRQGQAIMARMTQLSPDNAQWKQDFAWFERQIADLER